MRFIALLFISLVDTSYAVFIQNDTCMETCETGTISECCDCYFPEWSECDGETETQIMENIIDRIEYMYYEILEAEVELLSLMIKQLTNKIDTVCDYDNEPFYYGQCIEDGPNYEIFCTDGWRCCDICSTEICCS